MPEVRLLDAARLSSGYEARVVGREIRVLEEVSSTNDVVMMEARKGAVEGLVVFAERQTSGRGRLGRRWVSRPSLGLSFSVLLRPSWPQVARLSLLAAVAVARGISGVAGDLAGIKWPNDIWLRRQKVAGILCESAGDAVVIGIGLNVNHEPDDFPKELEGRATSLGAYAGCEVDREAVAVGVLQELDVLYERMPGAFPEVIAECERRSVLHGMTVRIEAGSELVFGVVTGLDEEGGLKVQTGAGPRVVTAGEVTLLKY